MKLLNLTIENFMGLTGTHQLALDALGLVHVAGRNFDDPGNNSNGSGKSTVLEALTWCLFGEGLPRPQGNSEQGVKADEVLNDRLGKQCRVVVELASDDELPIRVERWRKWKPADGTRQGNGQRLAIAGEYNEALDEKETNRLICEALGITHDIWCRGVVFGQESGFNFCDATAKARTEILTTVMGLEEIDQWLDKCRDEKRALTNKLATVGGRLGALRERVAAKEAEDVGQYVTRWEEDRAVRIGELEAEIRELEAQGKRLKAEAEAVVLPFVMQARKWPPIEAAVIEPPDTNYVTALVAELGRAQGVVKAVEADIARNDAEAARVAQLAAECPTCRQPIGDEHRAACDAEFGRIRAELQSQLLQRADEADKALQAANEAHARAEQERAAYRELVAKDNERQAALMAERQAYEEERNKTREAYHAKAAHKDRLEAQLGRERDLWRQYTKRLEEVRGEVNPHLETVERHQAELAQLKADLDAAEQEQARIGGALDTALWWDKEIPRFKTWMFDSVVDQLAAEANRWLGIMSGGVIWVQISTTKQVGKKLKDELDVRIYRWQPDGTITSRPYRVWSGGEKRRVALAVDLGLSRLMAQRASKAYRFLALDEVDRHLDDRGKDGLRQVLDELRRDKETVITVTHDPEFRASFDTEITVVRQKGRVRMEISHGRED